MEKEFLLWSPGVLRSCGTHLLVLIGLLALGAQSVELTERVQTGLDAAAERKTAKRAAHDRAAAEKRREAHAADLRAKDGARLHPGQAELQELARRCETAAEAARVWCGDAPGGRGRLSRIAARRRGVVP